MYSLICTAYRAHVSYAKGFAKLIGHFRPGDILMNLDVPETAYEQVRLEAINQLAEHNCPIMIARDGHFVEQVDWDQQF